MTRHDQLVGLLVLAVGITFCVGWLLDQWMQWAARRVYSVNDRWRATMAPQVPPAPPKKKPIERDRFIAELRKLVERAESKR